MMLLGGLLGYFGSMFVWNAYLEYEKREWVALTFVQLNGDAAKAFEKVRR